MSVRIVKGYQVEFGARGWGTTRIFASTLRELDALVESHFRKLEDARESRTRAILARLAGKQRADYRDARTALLTQEGVTQ